MRIAWEETIAKMRETGFSEDKIEEFRRYPMTTGVKFLELGRKLPLYAEDRGLVFEVTQNMLLETILKNKLKNGY